MTPEEIDALTDYTDAQLLKMYRRALLDLATHKSVEVNGRTLNRSDERFIRSTIEWLEDRIEGEDEDDDTNGGVALAVFGPAR